MFLMCCNRLQHFLSRFLCNVQYVLHVAVQASSDGLKKDVFLGKVADMSLEKRQWIENRLCEISDLMTKAGNMPEVSAE